MQVDGNIKALQNISKMQEVATNNIANASTDGFTASTAQQSGDRLTISPDARLAAMNSAGEKMSNSDPAQDMAKMVMNKNSFAANVQAIQIQEEMNQALLKLNK